jgi:thymidylate synthase
MSEHEEFQSLPYISNLLNNKRNSNESDKTNQNNENNENNEEQQYLNLLKTILEYGYIEEGRNGKTKSIFGGSMRFSLKNGIIPILTSKKVAWKTCLKELLWFIRGETNNKLLQKQDVHIWDGNSSKEYMEGIGLDHYPEGILGPIYGYQWRHFNAHYDVVNGCVLDENKPGIDQLQYIIDQLKNPQARNSRRLIMTAWNPCQLNKMALPPCHVMCQFNVHDGNKLSCAMYQRSVDVPIGSPFNIASYCFLTHLLAKHCGLITHEFVYFMGNCHIYEQHLDVIKEQIERVPFDFPTLEIVKKRENINDYVIDDFKIVNYQCHELIKMKMVA